jgi:hypothetical protein
MHDVVAQHRLRTTARMRSRRRSSVANLNTEQSFCWLVDNWIPDPKVCRKLYVYPSSVGITGQEKFELLLYSSPPLKR